MSFPRVRLLLPLLAVVASFGSMAAGRPGIAGGANVIFVDANAGGSGDGSSWTNAYPSLANALTAAVAPAELWVAEGVYLPGSLRTSTFTLPSGIAIRGGFAGGETSLAQRNLVTNRAVLSGDIGVIGIPTDNVYHVVTSTGEATAVLEGVVVAHGFANGANPADIGAGLYAPTGSPTVRDVTFRANATNGAGAGMYVGTGSPLVVRTAFTGNSADAGGGGFFNLSGSPTLRDVEFIGNTANTGGGWGTGGGSPTLRDALLRGNYAQQGGGAIVILGTPTIERSAFIGNRVEINGGGLGLFGGTATVRNVVFHANHANNGGGAIYGIAPFEGANLTIAGNGALVAGAVSNLNAGVTLTASIIWDNTGGQWSGVAGQQLKQSIIQGGCPALVTCNAADVVNLDPLLGNAIDNGGATPTMALAPGSPAIDRLPAAEACPPTDQRGVDRPADGNKDGQGRCDLGSFEYVPATPVASFAAPVSDGDEGDSPAQVAVELSTTSASTVTVKYKVTGGSASPGGAGKDFTLAAGTLTFPTGTLSRNISLAVVDDRFDEPNETVEISLTTATKAMVGTPKVHTFRITDDDPRRRCRGRLPTIIGTEANDTITGTNAPDIIVALGGNDIIDGGRADDLICGGTGNDTIKGGRGNDTLRGEAGNDTLSGEAGIDVLFGALGDDTLSGGPTTGDSCNGGPGKGDKLAPKAGCEAKAGIP